MVEIIIEQDPAGFGVILKFRKDNLYLAISTQAIEMEQSNGRQLSEIFLDIFKKIK